MQKEKRVFSLVKDWAGSGEGTGATVQGPLLKPLVVRLDPEEAGLNTHIPRLQPHKDVSEGVWSASFS